MKRVVAGWLVVAAVMVVAGWSSAFATMAPAGSAAPHGRVAIVNFGLLIMSHPKYQAAQKEIRENVRVYEEKDLDLQKEFKFKTALSNAIEGKGTAQQIIAAEEEVEKVRKQIDENRTAAKATTAKLAEDRMSAMKQDVKEAVERYPVAHDFELVLPIKETDRVEGRDDPQNLAHYLPTDGCLPLYAAPSVDVTKEVVAELNHK